MSTSVKVGCPQGYLRAKVQPHLDSILKLKALLSTEQLNKHLAIDYTTPRCESQVHFTFMRTESLPYEG